MREPAPRHEALFEESDAPRQRHVHQVITDDADLRLVFKSSSSAITNYLRSVRLCGVLQKTPPLSAMVLLLMIDCVSGKAYKRSGKLICWPSLGYLANECDKSVGHMKRAVAALVEIGLLKCVRRGEGKHTSIHQLVVPPETFNLIKKGSLTGRKAMVGGGSAGATTYARRRARGVSAGAPGVCAQARPRNGSREMVRRNETAAAAFSRTAPLPPPPEIAAAALEIQELGIGEEKAGELAALPTSTRQTIRAVKIETSRGGLHNPSGLAIALLLDPTRLSPKNVARAKEQIDREAQNAAAEAKARAVKTVAAMTPDLRERLLADVLATWPAEKLARAREQNFEPLLSPTVCASICDLAGQGVLA